jgi:DNA-binding GntR family transcriptional regulator
MTTTQFEPIADTTRRAEIVGRLRRAILTGQLQPSERVNELRIAQQMGVSRAPLREAIRELIQEGLLSNIPYAGTFVINVTAKDIDDAYSLHHVLEDFAIDRVWALRGDHFAAELDRRHEAVKQATIALDLMRQIESALKLHGLIYEWTDHCLLHDTWLRLAGRLAMYFAMHSRALNQPVPAVDIHEDYVRLLKGNDIIAAKRHAHEHIDSDFEALLAYARTLEKDGS